MLITQAMGVPYVWMSQSEFGLLLIITVIVTAFIMWILIRYSIDQEIKLNEKKKNIPKKYHYLLEE